LKEEARKTSKAEDQEVTSEGVGDVPEENQTERLRILTAAAEATVEKETQELRTRVKTNQDKPQDKRKKSKDNPQDKAQDSVKDSKTMETASYSENSVVSTPVSTVSRPLSQPESQPERAVSLSETDLEKERERLLKLKVAAEMLQSGWAIRDVSTELRLPKGTVEKISKTLRKETSSDLRKQYLDKPYQWAKEKLESADEEGESESLLESGWFERMQRKIWKMKIEADLMRRAGLLGDGGDGDRNSSRINLNEILLAKVVASGGSTSAQELANFAAALKGLFAPQQSQDPLQFYATIKNLENQSIQQNRVIETEAYRRAKADADRNILSDVVNKAVGVAEPLIKNVFTRPSIPNPTPVAPAGQIPGPETLDLQALRQGLLPEGEVLMMNPAENIDLGLGYSNLDSIRRKTKLVQEG
jgi:hypothetical protein